MVEKTTSELIPSVSIEAIVAQRDALAQTIISGCEMFRKAQAASIEIEKRVISSGALGGTYLNIENLVRPERWAHSPFREGGDQAILKTMDAQFWRLAMAASGNLTFMDAKAKREWSKMLEGSLYPEFTVENVRATFSKLRDERGETFKRGVVEVFKRLSWSYKSNCPVKFGKKIIMHWTSYGMPDSEQVDKLDDLVRVFSVLEGKPEPDHRQTIRPLLHQAEKFFLARGQHDFEHISLKWFKNGNIHVTFLKPDLVEQMNQILTEMCPEALPAHQF